MIAAVQGKIVRLSPGRVAVATGAGLILQLAVPVSSFQQLREKQEILLHAVLKIKDEDVALYGFLTLEEKALFEKLVAVSGIGAKTAMACVSAMAPAEWLAAVSAAEVARISSIPGIGKKTAQRLILELTGKLGLEAEGPESGSRLASDLVSGLVNLGYAVKGARETVSRVLKENPDRSDFEELFKITLKKVKQ